jgi:hypothetical protein
MAFLGVAMFDSLAALNPLLILPSIFRIAGAYLVTVFLFACAVATSWLGDEVLALALPIPILPSIISNFLGLYLAVLEMRFLGLLYLTHKGRLRWFAR